MSALLLVPAVPLAFAALGSALQCVDALRTRALGEVAGRLFWCLSASSGAAALASIAMGRPA